MKTVLVFTDENGSENTICTSETITITEIGHERGLSVFATIASWEAHLKDRFFWPAQQTDIKRQCQLTIPVWIEGKRYTVHLCTRDRHVVYYLDPDRAVVYGYALSRGEEVFSPEEHHAFLAHYNASPRPRSHISIGEKTYKAMQTPGELGKQLRGER